MIQITTLKCVIDGHNIKFKEFITIWHMKWRSGIGKEDDFRP